jgi:hypothetical protein
MSGRAVPMYVHPVVDPAAWHGLVGAPLGAGFVVANAADGPGERFDPLYDEAVAALLADGQTVLGYVDVGYGGRPAAQVAVDAAAWRALYDVADVFLDQVPSGWGGDDTRHDAVDAVGGIVAALRATGTRRVVLNPGTSPAPEVAAFGDAVVVFEGPWSEHAGAACAPQGLEPHRVVHLVHSVPADVPTADVVEAAGRAGAGIVGVSRLPLPNPWAFPAAGPPA